MDTYKRLKVLEEEKSSIREISQEVKEIDKRLKNHALSIRELFKKNFENKRYGYAVAHCQVVEEKPLRFFVINPIIFNGQDEENKIFECDTIINPVITEKFDEYKVKELCLSFPYGEWQQVKRYRKIKVEYQINENGKLSKPIKGKFDGEMAQVFQHEIEHFEGKTIYDEVEKVEKS